MTGSPGWRAARDYLTGGALCCQCEHPDHLEDAARPAEPARLPFLDWRRSPWHRYMAMVLPAEVRAFIVWPGLWSGILCKPCLLAGHAIGI